MVICESISRVARRAFEGLSVERELERADVPLFASNEPLTLSGSPAQRVLQRRTNQSIAEYEVLNTLEQSWGGLCTHVRDGWNIGQPPYGYRAEIVPHPSPVKALQGSHARSLGTKRCVQHPLQPEVHRLPVFNRRATTSKRGRVNEPYKWVWSPSPAHEPLIPKWLFDEINGDRTKSRGSRDGNTLNSHPKAERKYILRGRVVHSCGRRMLGDMKHKKVVYYLCWPGKNNQGKADLHPGLPTSIRVREDELLEAICRFYADRLFGTERRAILEQDLGGVDDTVDREREAERTRQQKLLATIARQQDSIMKQAREGDPDDPFTSALRQSYNDLEKQKNTSLTTIAELDKAERSVGQKTADLGRLEALPYLAVNLAKAPRELLGELFEVTQLSVNVHGRGDEVTITVRLPIDHLPKTAQAAETISDAMTATEPKSSVDLGQPSLGGSCLYPRWDSNPRYRRERPAS